MLREWLQKIGRTTRRWFDNAFWYDYENYAYFTLCMVIGVVVFLIIRQIADVSMLRP